MTDSTTTFDPTDLNAPNPLLEGYDAPLAYHEFGKRLSARPLAKVNWQVVSPQHREKYLDNPTAHYVPIRTSYAPAMGLQTLLRRALALLNPLRPENRVRVNRIALSKTPEELLNVGRADGAGGLWDGITGTGRSQLATRVLNLVVPEQVIDYGPSQACGWIRLRQVVWLHVDHPSNGTRMGLLKRILMVLDIAAGTSYFHDNRRVVNLDTLLVEVCAKLAMHRVAILVIDENHEENLDASPWQHEFVMFYQSVMNLGISILLIGNPLAFSNLMAYGQPVRRLMVGGIHHFLPAPSATEQWWAGDFIPRMRKFSVVEECEIEGSKRNKLEFEFTAGVPGLYPLLNVQAQRLALRRDGDRAVLKEQDLIDASRSPFYMKAKEIADCVLNKCAEAALRFRDIPSSGVASGGGSGDSSGTTDGIPKLPNLDKVSFDAVKKMVTKFRQQQSRAASRIVQKLEVFAALTPEERRMMGVSEELESAAMKLKAENEAAKAATAAAKAAAAQAAADERARKKAAKEQAAKDKAQAKSAKETAAAET
jgi:hypothetical protein